MTKNRRNAIVLFVSIALNLLLLGYVVGDRHHGRSHYNPGMAAIQSLPGADRDLLKNYMKAHHKEMHSLRKEAKERMHRLAELLGQEPLDIQALNTALNDLRAGANRGVEMVHTMVTELAPKLSPESRTTLVKMLRQHGRGMRGPGRHGKHMGGSGGPHDRDMGERGEMHGDKTPMQEEY